MHELTTNNVRGKYKLVPEAACKVNASTTYVCTTWKTRITPAPTQAMPYVEKTTEIQTLYMQERLTISVAIQCNPCSADHPVSSAPKGRRIVPGIIDAKLANVSGWEKGNKGTYSRNLNSGSPTPPFLFLKCI